MDELNFFDTDAEGKEIAHYVLTRVKEAGESTQFECPIGHGTMLMQRARMYISRIRKRLSVNGKPVARFRLEISTEQNRVTRTEVVTVTKKVSTNNRLEESIEDELSRIMGA